MSIVAQTLLTAEEFAQRPDPADGSQEELVRGVVITMLQPGFDHGLVQGRVYGLLDQHVRPRRVGRVTIESGVITERDPDTVRGPDVAYWSAERVPLDQRPRGYPDATADICVEVLSPSNRAAQMDDKVREYLDRGVRLVWVVDPDERTVTVHAPSLEPQELAETDALTGGNVLPEFQVRVAELFE
jgi:Uma2 family endonuclease